MQHGQEKLILNVGRQNLFAKRNWFLLDRVPVVASI
jgi:hypothetical protein